MTAPTDDVRATTLAVLRPLAERVLKVLEERHLAAEHTRESDRKDRLSQAVEEASLVHDALCTAVEASLTARWSSVHANARGRVPYCVP